MEFKGTQEKWFLFENVNENGRYLFTVRNENYANNLKDFQIQTSTISEVETLKANMLLCSKSTELLDELNETVTDLKILKGNILDALKTNHLFEGMPELIQKWINRKELLIKQTTEL
jgi:hypothetical protein